MGKTTNWFKAMRTHLQTEFEGSRVDSVLIVQAPFVQALDSGLLKPDAGGARATHAILMRRTLEEFSDTRGGANQRLISTGVMEIAILVSSEALNAGGSRMKNDELAFEVFDLCDDLQDAVEDKVGNPLSEAYSNEIISVADFDDPQSGFIGSIVTIGGRLLRTRG